MLKILDILILMFWGVSTSLGRNQCRLTRLREETGTLNNQDGYAMENVT